MSVTCEIAGNLASIRNRITAAAEGSGRVPDITLVAISKSHPPDRIRAALNANHRVFGENRVQEAYAKWQRLKESYSDVDLHLVGSLQTNKAGDAVALFDVIHTLDRDRLARALAREIERQGKTPTLYVQVNTGEEPQKAGVLPREADGFYQDVSDRIRTHGFGPHVHSSGHGKPGTSFCAIGWYSGEERYWQPQHGNVRGL